MNRTNWDKSNAIEKDGVGFCHQSLLQFSWPTVAFSFSLSLPPLHKNIFFVSAAKVKLYPKINWGLLVVCVLYDNGDGLCVEKGGNVSSLFTWTGLWW